MLCLFVHCFMLFLLLFIFYFYLFIYIHGRILLCCDVYVILLCAVTLCCFILCLLFCCVVNALMTHVMLCTHYIDLQTEVISGK